MSELVAVELFVEDHAHEKLLLPLVKRVAQKENVDVRCQMRTARGGHARAIKEFRLYQELWNSGFPSVPPDLIIVAIDSNCAAFAQTRVEIKNATLVKFQHRLVTACPDPHIERWYMADPNSFHEIVGNRPDLGSDKCERDYYKRLLRAAIQKGGNPQTLGGLEFAPELVAKMDLYQAGRADRSLKSFLDDLRSSLRNLQKSGGDHHVP